MATGLVQRLELAGDSSERDPSTAVPGRPDISADGAFVAYTSDLTVINEQLLASQVYVAPVDFDGPALDLAEVLSDAGSSGSGAAAGRAPGVLRRRWTSAPWSPSPMLPVS